MRVLRLVALGLLPFAAGCWIERPNLDSTGGGYTAAAAEPRPAEVGESDRTTGREEARTEPPPTGVTP